ncbi:MAG TPA: hypothetical protein VGS21_07085, partial [Acidimicrobiales bacterium]|nr:hypothetical protein [Acidimicrobiales bacterium]
AALGLLGDQVMAMITVTWAGGIGSLAGRTGYEFNITLAVLALVVVILGSGRLSADHVIATRIIGARSAGRRPPASPPGESAAPTGDEVPSAVGSRDPV